ncbi:MAG TPA: ABC transporter substrate-binding protein [Chloroflexota bacterium]|jgi:ABC-type nitrate/sulfonate/bicarbonate transport system substrate-binding protein
MAPAWFAAEGGYFVQRGLDVDLRYVATATTLTPALLAGEVQVALVGGGEIVQATLAGGDLVLVGSLVPVLVFSIYGAPGTTGLDDLAGKRIAVTRFGTATEFAAREALRRASLEPGRDVALIQAGGVPEALAALQAGGVEAAVLSPPTTLRAREAGLAELLDLGAAGVPYLQTAVATSQRQLADNPDALRRFLGALVDGIARARADRAFASAAIAAYTNNPGADVVDETYAAFVPRFPRQPAVPVEAVQAALAELAGRDERARTADPAQFYDNRLVADLEVRP